VNQTLSGRSIVRAEHCGDFDFTVGDRSQRGERVSQIPNPKSPIHCTGGHQSNVSSRIEQLCEKQCKCNPCEGISYRPVLSTATDDIAEP